MLAASLLQLGGRKVDRVTLQRQAISMNTIPLITIIKIIMMIIVIIIIIIDKVLRNYISTSHQLHWAISGQLRDKLVGSIQITCE